MKTVTILRGLPASGKSTYAKKLVEDNPGVYKRVNKDDLRAMIDCGKWSKANERMILDVRDAIILSALEHGKHVIVDDTNLHPKHIERIEQLVKGKAQVVVKMFEIDPMLAIERDLKRLNSVGSEVIMRMYNQFFAKANAVYSAPIGKPGAYIFDIDGTLALMSGRGPYDWSRVGEDEENHYVVYTLKSLQRDGFKIIIFTGRDGECKQETLDWLKDHEITFDHFDMRPPGNTEKDSVIKKRMFDKIKDDYHIMGVFDDRNQVVEMWRSLGLTCFQVAEGNF